MKQLYVIPFVVLIAASCSAPKQIGSVNMIATRNIDPDEKYEVLSRYSGSSKKEMRKSKAKSIEDAIDKTVKRIPGGEYLMNAKIFLVGGEYLAVEGDVWGLTKNNSIRGLKIGDRVTWKKYNKYYKGKITAFKDAEICIVEDDSGKTLDVNLEELVKIE